MIENDYSNSKSIQSQQNSGKLYGSEGGQVLDKSKPALKSDDLMESKY